MKFQEIRSATAIITFGGVRFLLDPWLGADQRDSQSGCGDCNPSAFRPF